MTDEQKPAETKPKKAESNGKRKPGKWYAKGPNGALTGYGSAEAARRSICPEGNAIYVKYGVTIKTAKERGSLQPPKGGFWWAENPAGEGAGFATEGPALAHAVPKGVAWFDDGETIRL